MPKEVLVKVLKLRSLLSEVDSLKMVFLLSGPLGLLSASVSQQERIALVWYTKFTVQINSSTGSCSRIFSALKPRLEVWVGKGK